MHAADRRSNPSAFRGRLTTGPTRSPSLLRHSVASYSSNTVLCSAHKLAGPGTGYYGHHHVSPCLCQSYSLPGQCQAGRQRAHRSQGAKKCVLRAP